MREKNIFWMTLVTLLLTSLLMAIPVTSSPATEIRVPTIVDTTLGPGDTFDVDVTLVDVTNLYGWDVVLNFNPMVLEATAVAKPTPNFLGPASLWGIGMVWPVINNFMGTVTMGDTFLPPLPAEGVSGSGTLLTITFEVKAENAITTLSLDPTELYTYESGWKMKIPHERIDGYFDNRVTILPPDADFYYNPPVAITYLPVTFTSTSTDPDGGWIVSYYWDFGDGTNATGEIVDHIYATEGVYTVTLNVTDNDGLTDEQAVDITVYEWFNGGTFADLVGWLAKPEEPKLREYAGERTLNLLASVGNPTDEPMEVYVDFTIVSKDELKTLGTLTTAVNSIDPHTTVELNVVFDTNNEQWDVSAGPWGDQYLKKYWAFAQCYCFRDGEWKPGNFVNDLSFGVWPGKHDAALLSATPNATDVTAGELVAIDMVVQNQGAMSETFDVTLRHGDDVTVQTVALAVNETTTVTFLWDSTGLAGQNAVLWCELPTPAVIYESDFTDQSEVLVIHVS